jgi:hypothetical protein
MGGGVEAILRLRIVMCPHAFPSCVVLRIVMCPHAVPSCVALRIVMCPHAVPSCLALRMQQTASPVFEFSTSRSGNLSMSVHVCESSFRKAMTGKQISPLVRVQSVAHKFSHTFRFDERKEYFCLTVS